MHPVPSAPGARPRLLVSVRSCDEARAALAAGADLIDAKDPDRGALGALATDVVRAIVAAMAGRAVTSAVAGEPAGPEAMAETVRAMAATGAGYVKVAVRPGDLAHPGPLAAAAGAAPGRLVAVLFAEDGAAAPSVAPLAAAGFAGAMIDTLGKDGRRLGDWLAPEALEAFTETCGAHGLLSGLAGSLRVADIPVLSGHAPGYLGFRGGLCEGGDRRRALDPARIRAAVAALAALPRADAA
ncbi:(5-formylfuran-3-yl)methyl phosphate synthase [Methylobacterium sp. A54F]